MHFSCSRDAVYAVPVSLPPVGIATTAECPSPYGEVSQHQTGEISIAHYEIRSRVGRVVQEQKCPPGLQVISAECQPSRSYLFC